MELIDGSYANDLLTKDVMQGIYAKMAIFDCNVVDHYEQQVIADFVYSGENERT